MIGSRELQGIYGITVSEVCSDLDKANGMRASKAGNTFHSSVLLTDFSEAYVQV